MSISILTWNIECDPRTNPVKLAAFHNYLVRYDFTVLQQCDAFANLTGYNNGNQYQCYGILRVGANHVRNSVAILSAYNFTKIDDITLQDVGKNRILVQDESYKKRYIASFHLENKNLHPTLSDLNQFLDPCRRHQNSLHNSQLRYTGDHSGFELIVVTDSIKLIPGAIINDGSSQYHNNWCCLKSNAQQTCSIYYWRAQPLLDQTVINPEDLSINNRNVNDKIPLVSHWK